MGALYIKDERTAFLAERVASRLGTTKTEAVRRALEAIERDLAPMHDKPARRERLLAYLNRDPLPARTGRKADKAFFDRLWGEE